MDTRKGHTQGSTGAGWRGAPPSGTPPARPNGDPASQPRGWGRKRWLIIAVILGVCALGVVGVLVYSAKSNTLTWREEVALQDDGTILVTWQVWFAPGQPFQVNVGRQRMTFAHPLTGKPVAWDNPGRVGSRLKVMLLAVDAGQLFLVGRAPTSPDYDGFGCPTPPYIVFRYDAGTWVRVALDDLPARFGTPNLMGFAEEDLLRRTHFVTAAQAAAHYASVRSREDTFEYGAIDRRPRNPLTAGCSRGAIERIYGVEKYDEWRKTGTWLDKSPTEVANLLRRKSEGAKP